MKVPKVVSSHINYSPYLVDLVVPAIRTESKLFVCASNTIFAKKWMFDLSSHAMAIATERWKPFQTTGKPKVIFLHFFQI